MDEFANLLSQETNIDVEGKVVAGIIKSISDEFVIVDIGLKSEGYVPIEEYKNEVIEVNQETNVYVVFVDNINHECILSHSRAKKEEVWHSLQKSYNDGALVTGTITKQIKGGLSVDISGVNTFLPGSQIDSKLMHNISSLIGVTQEFHIIKIDLSRGDIVISSKFQDKNADANASHIIDSFKEGDICTGVVKNITNYGAFINLGNIDGLLHLIDISWTRINYPQEVLNIGDKIEVVVIKIDREKKRINLGLKQLTENPWKKINEKCKVNTVIEGVVTNINDYGAFVEIEKGIEGLIHISEISWTKNDINAAKFFKKGEKIKVLVLDCNVEKRRIALGLKQLTENPWTKIAEKYVVNSIAKGTITNIDPNRGINVALEDGIEGMVGLSNISWESSGAFAIKKYSVGDKIDVKIMEVNAIKGKLLLSIKHLVEDPVEAVKQLEKGQVVTCVIVSTNNNGVEVMILPQKIKGFIGVNHLSSIKNECNPHRFVIGDKIDALVMNVDYATGKVNLSIKTLELNERQRIIKEYGSATSGAQLGDILGFALDETKRKLESNLNQKTNDK